ncbi:MAG: hypothetical protein ACRC4M_02040 [Mycoplasma sp.]
MKENNFLKLLKIKLKDENLNPYRKKLQNVEDELSEDEFIKKINDFSIEMYNDFLTKLIC